MLIRMRDAVIAKWGTWVCEVPWKLLCCWGSHEVVMESRDKISVENGEAVVIVTFEEWAILEALQIRRLDRVLMPIIRRNPDKRLVLNFSKVKFVSSLAAGPVGQGPQASYRIGRSSTVVQPRWQGA